MCVNDWRFGTLIRTQVTAVSLTVGLSRIIAPDPQRVGISFMIPLQAAGVLGTLASGGSVLQQYGPLVVDPLHITLATHGDFSTREFVLVSLVGTFAASVVEYTAPQSYITAALEEFRRQYPAVFR